MCGVREAVADTDNCARDKRWTLAALGSRKELSHTNKYTHTHTDAFAALGLSEDEEQSSPKVCNTR